MNKTENKHNLQPFVNRYSGSMYADGYFHYAPVTFYKEFVE